MATRTPGHRARKGSHASKAKPRASRARARSDGARSARETSGTAGDGVEREEPERRGPRPFWSGTISFGLVSVPVDLHTAVRSTHLPTRMLAADGTALQRHYVCPEEERDVTNDELVRGYEVAPDEHVVITDEELEALAPRASRDIDLRRFVPVQELDPFLFEASYVLAPSGDSPKAYRLLAKVMEADGRAGIATFVLREKEKLIAILARNGILHAESLRFSDEVRGAKDAALPPRGKVPATLVDAFERAVSGVRKKFDLDDLHDEEAAALRELVEEKQRRGKDVLHAQQPAAGDEEETDSEGDPSDLLAALKRSLAAGRASAPASRRIAAPSHRTGEARAGTRSRRKAHRRSS